MKLEETRVGARVRVRPGYRKSELWGALGTIAEEWGAPNYAAVKVRLDGGRSELLWRHELEEIPEEVQQDVFAHLRWGGEELEVAGMAPASSVITPQTAGAREEE